MASENKQFCLIYNKYVYRALNKILHFKYCTVQVTMGRTRPRSRSPDSPVSRRGKERSSKKRHKSSSSSSTSSTASPSLHKKHAHGSSTSQSAGILF